MAEPTDEELQEAAATAAKEVLDGGVTGYSHAGRSRTMLNPREMRELSREIEQDGVSDTHGIKTFADLRS